MADTYATYLTFDGDCREAFKFYSSVFGEDFHVFDTFAEAPAEMDVPEGPARSRDARVAADWRRHPDGQRHHARRPAVGDRQQLLPLRWGHQQGREQTSCSPSSRRAAPLPCRWRPRSGAPTSACVRIGSASTGWWSSRPTASRCASFHPNDCLRHEKRSLPRSARPWSRRGRDHRPGAGVRRLRAAGVHAVHGRWACTSWSAWTNANRPSKRCQPTTSKPSTSPGAA